MSASTGQLSLFEGPHVPRTAAREALVRGAIDEARARLAPVANPPEAADARRLERLVAALGPAQRGSAQRDSGDGGLAAAVHDAFATALRDAEPAGFLGPEEWFRVYAARLVDALRAEPSARFRGWAGLHFAYAAGNPEAALHAARRVAADPAAAGALSVEAARIAFALDRGSEARAWLRAGCLAASFEPVADPPALDRSDSGVLALDATPPLPALPAAIEELFAEVAALPDLPSAPSHWVAVVGEIDRSLAAGPERGEAATAADRPAGDDHGDPAELAPPPHKEPARAFLEALHSARRSRERDGPRNPGHCSDRELRARRRMQRISPLLLARYLRGLQTRLL